MPRLTTGSPGSSAEPERRAHVVARAGAHQRPGVASELARGRRRSPRRRLARAEHLGQQRAVQLDEIEHVVDVVPPRVDHQPVPDASPRSVAPRPHRRSVRKSCGSRTARAAAATLGLVAAQPRPRVAVKDGHGHQPDPLGPFRGPPSASRQLAGLGRGAGVVPEDRGAQRATVSSSTTRPCCWPATEIAATSPATPALVEGEPQRLPPHLGVGLPGPWAPVTS